MDPIVHELDPDGDVVLVLQHPNEAFAVWDESEHLTPPSVPAPPLSEEQRLSPQLAIPPPSNPPSSADEEVTLSAEPEDGQVRMRVSSSHLALASPYFKWMLRGDWKEGHTLRSDGNLVLHEKDWDPDALLVLMNIIHGHTRKLPRSVNLEMLAKIAVLVDYYRCVEVVEVFSEIWINKLKNTLLPKSYSRDLILWILVSWIFHQPTLFRSFTGIAIKESRGPIQTLGLPIPERIVGRYRI
jgi:hypothetical protein